MYSNFSMFNMMGMNYPYMGTDCYGKQPSFGETLAQGLVYSFANTGMGVINSIFNGMFSGLNGCISGAIGGGGGGGSSASATGNGGSGTTASRTQYRAIDAIEADINAALAQLGSNVSLDNYTQYEVETSYTERVTTAEAALATLEGNDAVPKQNGDSFTPNYGKASLTEALAEYQKQLTAARAERDAAIQARNARIEQIQELKQEITTLREEKANTEAALEADRVANQQFINDIRTRGTIEENLFTTNSDVTTVSRTADEITMKEASQLIDYYIKHNKRDKLSTVDGESIEHKKAESIRDFFKSNLGNFDNRIMNRYGDAIRLIANDDADRYGIL